MPTIRLDESRHAITAPMLKVESRANDRPRAQTIVRRVPSVYGSERFCVLHETSLPVPNAFAFICAGGLSNLIDRVAYDGRVVDFLNVGIGALRTGIFNIADMGITFGALLMLLESFRSSRSAELPEKP